ncbi:hypothetical protein HDV00_000034 [Rhizophlyctis rosea]|nr:hypothetical protein HDV00_000034 [Rhizophlyctis rosea]
MDIEQKKIEHVLNLDLTNLEQRMKRSNPSTPSNLIIEYKRFLVLKIKLQDTNTTILSPSPLIDECWHHHILDTRHYQKMMNVVDMVIHHNPDGGEDEAARKKRRQTTLAAYEKYFATKPPADIWNMFEDEELGVKFEDRKCHIKRKGDELELDAPDAKRKCEGK